MMAELDMDKIAQGLGAERKGKVTSTSGYFGTLQLLAEIEARLRVPRSGGRAPDPEWTERRLVPLTPRTLKRLDDLTARVKERTGVPVESMQIAALLLEQAAERLSKDEADELFRVRRRAS